MRDVFEVDVEDDDCCAGICADRVGAVDEEDVRCGCEDDEDEVRRGADEDEIACGSGKDDDEDDGDDRGGSEEEEEVEVLGANATDADG
jgi:hypothetical protein